MAKKQCESCGVPIRWAKSAKGKWLCLDAEKTEGGNVVLFLDEREQGATGVVFKSAVEAEAKFPGRPRYTSHHMTCKQGKEWRRR